MNESFFLFMTKHLCLEMGFQLHRNSAKEQLGKAGSLLNPPKSLLQEDSRLGQTGRAGLRPPSPEPPADRDGTWETRCHHRLSSALVWASLSPGCGSLGTMPHIGPVSPSRRFQPSLSSHSLCLQTSRLLIPTPTLSVPSALQLLSSAGRDRKLLWEKAVGCI